MADVNAGFEVIQAANFVTGALLISLGLVIIVATILVINNLFSRFWKPVRVFTYIAAKISPEDAATLDSKQVERNEPQLNAPSKQS